MATSGEPWKEMTACLAVRARILSRRVTAVYEEALRHHGLTAPQMNLLVATANMGTARPAEVCAALEMDPSTLSRVLAGLVKAGLIEVVPEEDGRARPFRPTVAGRELIARMIEDWRAAQERTAELLGPEMVRALRDAVPLAVPE